MDGIRSLIPTRNGPGQPGPFPVSGAGGERVGMAKPTQQSQPAATQQAPPTMDDVNAIGNAAAGAAQAETQAGGNADAAGQAAAAAAQAEAEARKIHLPPEVIEQIARASAAATVAELASQGAVEPPREHQAAEQQQTEGEDQAGQGEGDQAGQGEQPPRKTTFAEKVLGGYKR